MKILRFYFWSYLFRVPRSKTVIARLVPNDNGVRVTACPYKVMAKDERRKEEGSITYGPISYRNNVSAVEPCIRREFDRASVWPIAYLIIKEGGNGKKWLRGGGQWQVENPVGTAWLIYHSYVAADNERVLTSSLSAKRCPPSSRMREVRGRFARRLKKARRGTEEEEEKYRVCREVAREEKRKKVKRRRIKRVKEKMVNGRRDRGRLGFISRFSSPLPSVLE